MSVSLSHAVRQNLLSLQNTSDLLATTQNRLSTGLKVNSALDDPTAYFTASSLNSRAGDLNRLLDSVGNAVQTVRAADDGIKAITKLVESAQATARQAQQKPAGSSTPTTLTGTTTIADDTAATITGTVTTLAGTDELVADLGFTATETITVTDGTDTTTFTIGATSTVTDLVAALDGGAAAVSATLTGGALVITSDNTTDSITLGGTANADFAALGVNTTAVGPTNASVAALTDTLSIQINSETAETIDLSAIDTKADLDTALAGITGLTASVTGGNLTLVAGSADDAITIAGGDGVGLTNGTTDAPRNSDRNTLRTEFNNLRTQINQLITDTSYNGNNLLNGDSLSVIFNEDGSSKLDITGVTFTATGLGISEAATDAFQTNTSIDTVLTELSSAISTLRSQGGTFGSNLSIVEVRQEFSKNLINTLETGAAKLTLADSNEEAANLLALQTRQQLSSQALSLASRADQQVLSLLR